MSRGGRGRGRGGKPNIFTPQLLGHLDYQLILQTSKQGHELYPTGVVEPDTTLPNSFESSVANKFSQLQSRLYNTTPYYLNAPVKKGIDPFEFARVDDDRPTPTSSTNTSRKRDLKSFQQDKQFVIIDQSELEGGEEKFLKENNRDASLLPSFYLELYPLPDKVRALAQKKLDDQGQHKKQRKALDAIADVSDVEDIDSDANSASDLDNGMDDEDDEEAGEGDEEENDYGGNHFDGGDGDGDDALDGGGDDGGDDN